MNKTIATIAASAALAALAGCSSEDPAPDPFTIRAEATIDLAGTHELIATPRACRDEDFKTETGTWTSGSPIIFRQGDKEIGTGAQVMTFDKTPGALGGDCISRISGTVSPASGDEITAVLPDGQEWKLTVDEWKAQPTTSVTAEFG